MEKVLSNGFFEMTSQEMDMVTGGGVLQALAAFGGTVLIGISPAVGVAAGIGASVVGTPVIGVSAGVAAGAGLAATGAGLLDWACQ